MAYKTKFDGARIKEIRKRRGLSAEKVAEMTGLSPATIYRYENGDIASMPAVNLKPIADALGVEPGDLIGWEDAPLVPGAETLPYLPPRAQIPVIGSVRCGPGGLAYEEPLGIEGADVANAEDYFYLRAEGDSMEPQVFAGDLVLVHKQPDVESGEVAVVVLNGDEGMLKKVIKKNGAVILQSYNPAHPPRVLIGDEISSLRIAGKAVQLLRKW